MLNLTKSRLVQTKKRLENERDVIDEQILNLTREDPFLQEDRTGSRELAQDASDTAGHDRIVALKAELVRHRTTILAALSKIGIGTYGRCEACKQMIEDKRLHIMPMATLCVACEQKLEHSR